MPPLHLFLTIIPHFVRVHPVRTAVALSLLVMVGVLVWAYWQYRRDLRRWNTKAPSEKKLKSRRPQKPYELWIAAAFRLPNFRLRRRYILAITTISVTVLAGSLSLAFGYRFYTNTIVKETVLPVEFEASTTFGIDVSHYQAHIDWPSVAKSQHRIKFVFIRASMGADGIDTRFQDNWNGAKEVGLIRGAYHYYRPSDDPTLQFANYQAQTSLLQGDFYPVLDIETIGRRQSPETLREKLQLWLNLAESYYGVKPIIYTGQTFYLHHLEGHFPDYPLWMAHYSAVPDTLRIDWRIHQFSDRIRVRGILDRVDGNYFRGTVSELKTLCF